MYRHPATLLSVVNWMRLGMNAQAAINAPRFHHQWLPDEIVLEKEFPLAFEQALNARGHATPSLLKKPADKTTAPTSWSRCAAPRP